MMPGARRERLPFVLLAVGSSKRVRLMQAARVQMGLPAATLVEWQAWLANPAVLGATLSRPCVFKIETPGDDQLLHHQLLQAGCELLGLAAPAAPGHGEISVSDAWFAGLTKAMRELEAQLRELPHVQVLNAPHEILAMTDKLTCQQHLHAHGVPVPRLLGPVKGYAHFCELLDAHGLDQAFVKARYGSSASGVIAYRRNRRGAEQATSSAHLVRGAGAARLYNVKRLRTYDQHDDIVQLLELLACQHAYAETWLPKPRAGKGHFDVRVLTLAGQPAHRIARVGARMMTNLHLDNQRADVDDLVGADGRAALEQVARDAAAAFPASHVIGLDLVVRKGRAQVLEANAFGDLLPGLLWRGHDTYAGQLQKYLAHEA
jgi:glutathione synthase/RimK-type ligase-like ATP-grasp enzyme